MKNQTLFNLLHCSIIAFVLCHLLSAELRGDDDTYVDIELKHRIVGGSEAIPHEFPWIVLIRFNGRFCSGVILNSRWILTAGHCSQDPISSYRIRAGMHNKNVASKSQQIVRIETIVVHPDYNADKFQNDIALLKVKPEFKFATSVKPIRIVTSNFQPISGIRTLVAGWGSVDHKNNQGSNVLRKVSTPIVDLRVCRQQYKELINITDSHICTGQSGRSSCAGDSGSPVLCRSSPARAIRLCGIVSGAKGCGGLFPQVNSNVQYYSHWINLTIQFQK